jgi:general stress protein 26
MHAQKSIEVQSEMAAATTTIDSRFSDPNAAPTSWDETRRALETAEMFWITSVRADGRPHMTPLVAVWLDEALHFTTGPSEQKSVNLRGNPHVILSTGCNSWDSGLDVIVEGEAIKVTDAAVLEQLAQAWTTKWDGRWQFEVRDQGFFHDEGGGADVFAVRPTKVLTFGKGTFSQTRHRF